MGRSISQSSTAGNELKQLLQQGGLASVNVRKNFIRPVQGNVWPFPVAGSLSARVTYGRSHLPDATNEALRPPSETVVVTYLKK